MKVAKMTKNEAVDILLAALPGWTACRLSKLHLYRPDGTLGLVLSDRDVVAAAERIAGRAIAALSDPVVDLQDWLAASVLGQRLDGWQRRTAGPVAGARPNAEINAELAAGEG